ncbi:unnamed protein product, partial [Effrenium voratum]
VQQEVIAILSSCPGLDGVTAAWKALLLEEQQREFQGDPFLDDASTECGSELPELSVCSAASSSPGPGSYTPNFEALRPRLAKGAPSFGRYCARDTKDPKEKPAEEEDEATESMDQEDERFTCRGGKILPTPSTRPRRPTISQLDALAAAQRPLSYVVSEDPPLPLPLAQVEASAPAPVETGRLERLEKVPGPGPGDYEVSLAPGGPSAVIAPPPEPAPEVPPGPGPAEYDLRASQAHVFPRGPAAGFGLSRESWEHQRCPEYIASYDDLDVKYVTEPRSVSALILPEESEEAARARRILQYRAPAGGTGPDLGPGVYDEYLVQRIRPDLAVLPWRPKVLPEHLLGLYQHYAPSGRLRLDGRPLLGTEEDLALRRQRPRAFIQPLGKPRLKRSWSSGDIWRFYLGQPDLPEPLGRASFARNLGFEQWQVKEKHWRWLAVRHFRRNRCSLQLSYSLPDLNVLKERAMEVDFGKALGRTEPEEDSDGDVLLLSPARVLPRTECFVDMAKQTGREEEQEEEGDVLLLSPVQAPRIPCFVDMGRQTGREEEEKDDFEELVLSPKRPEKRSHCFVDMARDVGRNQASEEHEEEVLLTNWSPPFTVP